MMTWEEHLAWCRRRSPEHLAGIPSPRNAAGAIVVDLSEHPEFEDRMGRALREGSSGARASIAPSSTAARRSSGG